MRLGCETPSTGVAANLAQDFSALVPVLTTNRLTLRAPRVEDFAAYADVACTERGAGIGGPMSRADAWWDFVQLASGWMLHGHGGWTLECRNEGTVEGFVILGFEPGDLEPELGYLLVSASEGKGLAVEAASAARDWAANYLKWSTLVSYIAPENHRSIALAKRLGAVRDGQIDDAEGSTLIYRYRLKGTH